jgi:hypothetical protein
MSLELPVYGIGVWIIGRDEPVRPRALDSRAAPGAVIDGDPVTAEPDREASAVVAVYA